MKNYVWVAAIKSRATGETEYNKVFILPTECGITAATAICEEYEKENGGEWLVVFLNCLGEALNLNWQERLRG